MWILNGDVNEPGDVGVGPGKSYLFFLTSLRTPGIGLSREGVRSSEEPRHLCRRSGHP